MDRLRGLLFRTPKSKCGTQSGSIYSPTTRRGGPSKSHSLPRVNFGGSKKWFKSEFKVNVKAPGKFTFKVNLKVNFPTTWSGTGRVNYLLEASEFGGPQRGPPRLVNSLGPSEFPGSEQGRRPPRKFTRGE